jgi:predicted nucleotidyltransferase
MISEIEKNKILEVLTPYKPERVGIFGSYSRGENNKDSDLDILVDFGKTINLLELIGIEIQLTEAIGIQVDLITERALNPKLKPYIEKDLNIIM